MSLKASPKQHTPTNNQFEKKGDIKIQFHFLLYTLFNEHRNACHLPSGVKSVSPILPQNLCFLQSCEGWQVLDISGSTSLHIVLIFAYCCLYWESPCLSASFIMKYQCQLEFCPCHTVDLIWWQLVQEPNKQPCAALAAWACLVLHRWLHGRCPVGEQLWRSGLGPSWVRQSLPTARAVIYLSRFDVNWHIASRHGIYIPTCVIESFKFHCSVYAAAIYHNNFLGMIRSSKNTCRKQLPFLRCFGFFFWLLTFHSIQSHTSWPKFIRHLKPDRFPIYILCIYFFMCAYIYSMNVFRILSAVFPMCNFIVKGKFMAA